MEIEAVLDKLMEAGVVAWLDPQGKLRIDADASAELRELVRQHKQELIDVRKAQDVMNGPGVRGIRLPLGRLAVACPLNGNLEQIRWAMRVLRMDSMPLVINDEGLMWRPYRNVDNHAQTDSIPGQKRRRWNVQRGESNDEEG